MGIDDHNKREAIKKVYNSASWDVKVDAMPEMQVTALYLKFQREGKI